MNAFLKDKFWDALGDDLLIVPMGRSPTSLSASNATPAVVAIKGTGPHQAQVGSRLISISAVTTRRVRNLRNYPKSSMTSCTQKGDASHAARKGTRAATAPCTRPQGRRMLV